MSHPRKAHTNEIIDRRLQQAESSGTPDPMELISLYDELARTERKWHEKASGSMSRGTRPPANAAALNARFDRLSRLVTVALRQSILNANDPLLLLLQRTSDQINARRPLPES